MLFLLFYSRPDLALQLLDELGHPVHVLPVLVGSELHLLDAALGLQGVLVRLRTSDLGGACRKKKLQCNCKKTTHT